MINLSFSPSVIDELSYWRFHHPDSVVMKRCDTVYLKWKGLKPEQWELLPDDLIVMVNNQLTPSLAAVEHRIHQIPPDQPVTLTIERNAILREVVFQR
jgi:hypothetical protein